MLSALNINMCNLYTVYYLEQLAIKLKTMATDYIILNIIDSFCIATDFYQLFALQTPRFAAVQLGTDGMKHVVIFLSLERFRKYQTFYSNLRATY